MIKINNRVQAANSTKAWEDLNEAFITSQAPFNLVFMGKAVYAFDVVLGISHPKLDPDFDFGRYFNYTPNKWSHLISNYLDKEDLKKARAEVRSQKPGRTYNISLNFTNSHLNGKSCLLSMIFTKRVKDSKPYIIIFMRASEITKRLPVDLLFFQRVGEYVFGKQEFQLVIHFNQLFQDDAVLLMYHAHKDVREILKECTGERKEKLLKLLDDMLKRDPETFKYKVHKRAAIVLHPELYDYQSTLARDCKLKI